MSWTSRRIVAAILVGGSLLVGTLLATPLAHAESSSYSTNLVAPTGTSQLWLGVDKPGLQPAAIVVKVSGACTATVTMKQTALGLQATLPCAPGQVTLMLDASQAINAHVSATFANSRGVVLKAWDGHVALIAASVSSSAPPSPVTPSTTGPSTIVPPTDVPSTGAPATTKPTGSQHPTATPSTGVQLQVPTQAPPSAAPSAAPSPIVATGGEVTGAPYSTGLLGCALAGLFGACIVAVRRVLINGERG